MTPTAFKTIPGQDELADIPRDLKNLPRLRVARAGGAANDGRS